MFSWNSLVPDFLKFLECVLRSILFIAGMEAKPWLTHGEWVMAVLTAIYVGLTAVYVRISHKTLKAIKGQAESSDKQFREQLTVAKDAATAAQQNADAAKVNAQVILNAERAWVSVELLWSEFTPLIMEGSSVVGEVHSTHTTFAMRLVCRNQGRTPAWITEKRIIALADLIQIERETLAPGKESTRRENVSSPGHVDNTEKLAAIYGIVRYQDIFGEQRHTTFGYYVKRAHDPELIPGLPKYNEST